MIMQKGMTEETKEANLLAMLEMNWEHARHVENERISLNSIFTAIVAGVLAFTLGSSSPLTGIVSTSMLLLACVLSMLLNKRWSDVFDGHSGIIKNLYEQLFGEKAEENKYYYTKHVPKTKGYYFPLKQMLKIRTRDLFAYFYNIIFLALCCLLAYYIYLI